MQYIYCHKANENLLIRITLNRNKSFQNLTKQQKNHKQQNRIEHYTQEIKNNRGNTQMNILSKTKREFVYMDNRNKLIAILQQQPGPKGSLHDLGIWMTMLSA